MKKVIGYIFSMLIICISSIFLSESLNNSGMNKPSRIVVFPLHAEEILLSMISPERIVYVGHSYFDNDNYSPTISLTRNIKGGTWQNTDEEDILSLAPDLIIFPDELENDYRLGSDLFPKLLKAQIPTLFVPYPHSIDDIQKNISIIGQVVGEVEKAESLIRRMDIELAEFEPYRLGKKANNSPRIIYYNNWQESFPIILQQLGIENIFSTDEYFELDDNEIAAWEPDYIFYNPIWIDSDGTVLEADESYSSSFAQSIYRNSAFEKVPAIEQNNIFPIYLHSSHFILKNIHELAALIEHHPISYDSSNATPTAQ